MAFLAEDIDMETDATSPILLEEITSHNSSQNTSEVTTLKPHSEIRQITHSQQRINDPVFVIKVLLVWLSLVVIFFALFGLMEGKFFSFGPQESTQLFGQKIDTWTKWTVVMVFNFVDMLLYEWATEIIRPFIINTIQDHKTTEMKVSKFTVFFIVNAFELCGYFRLIINIQMIFTQLDFMVAVFLGNALSQNVTTWSYIKRKAFVNSIQT